MQLTRSQTEAVLRLLKGPEKSTVKIEFEGGKTVELVRDWIFSAAVSDKLSGVGLVLEESEMVSMLFSDQGGMYASLGSIKPLLTSLPSCSGMTPNGTSRSRSAW